MAEATCSYWGVYPLRCIPTAAAFKKCSMKTSRTPCTLGTGLTHFSNERRVQGYPKQSITTIQCSVQDIIDLFPCRYWTLKSSCGVLLSLAMLRQCRDWWRIAWMSTHRMRYAYIVCLIGWWCHCDYYCTRKERVHFILLLGMSILMLSRYWLIQELMQTSTCRILRYCTHQELTYETSSPD